jgi:prolipoprotein diacylglyceryl transferase
MINLFIHWDVNPEIFRIGSFAVRWYGLLFASGFYFGYLILAALFKREKVGVAVLDKLAFYMIISTVIGARLGHCLFYEPAYYLSNPFEILKIWEGGLASHGAAIGILIALWIFSRKTGKSFLWTIDRIVIVTALAGAFIRAGNLMNSEIIGIPSQHVWAFIFTRVDMIPRHPAQIYEALAYLTSFFILLAYYNYKKTRPAEGVLFGLFLIIIFTARFLIEYVKEVQVAFETTLPLKLGQLLSIPFILLGIFMLIRPFLFQKKKS